MTVSDYIANHLKSIGVDTVFSLAGGLVMGITDALFRAGIRQVFQNHEQCCGFAADAYARQTGRLGVAVLTGGPGGLNAITGIVGAYQDSIPVLFLVGQCKRASTMAWTRRDDVRQLGTFEVDLIPIVKSITKFAEVVSCSEIAEAMLKGAIGEATTGRPGPVVLEIPLDVQGAECSH